VREEGGWGRKRKRAREGEKVNVERDAQTLSAAAPAVRDAALLLAKHGWL
jgi:hypothetical protein